MQLFQFGGFRRGKRLVFKDPTPRSRVQCRPAPLIWGSLWLRPMFVLCKKRFMHGKERRCLSVVAGPDPAGLDGAGPVPGAEPASEPAGHVMQLLNSRPVSVKARHATLLAIAVSSAGTTDPPETSQLRLSQRIDASA